MNIPKGIATVIVAVIVVGILYTTFAPAMPEDMSKAPFELELVEGSSTSVEVDGDYVTVTLQEFQLTSNLGKTLEGVELDFGLDAEKNYNLGTMTFGDIEPGQTKVGEYEPIKVPVAVYMSSIIMDEDEGKISMPVVAGFKFQYIQWMNHHILDLDIGLQADLSQPGTIEKTVSGDTLVCTCTLESGSSLSSILEDLSNKGFDDAEITIPDSEFGIGIEIPGDGSGFVLKITGTADDLRTLYDERGKLVFETSGHAGTVVLEDKEDVESFISMIESQWGTEVVPDE